MKKRIRYIGLDVHAETIAVAVAEEGRDGEVRSLGRIANRPENVRKLMKKLGDPKMLRACYEAGPCGYVLYWQLVSLGVHCDVIAPTLVPKKPGDRVKTDRRDAVKLARCYRAGDLTPVWVPDAEHEALRDLVRARQAAKQDEHRARHRLGKFLLRHGRRPPQKLTRWSTRYLEWLRGVRFDSFAQQQVMVDYLHEVVHQAQRVRRLDGTIEQVIGVLPEQSRELIQGLQALRGVATITAVTIVSEVGRLSRFDSPTQLMGYVGNVPSERSTGGPSQARRGRITKAGNSQLRRIVGEAACNYRHRPAVGAKLKRRQEHVSEEVKEIAWQAQHRLHERYRHLSARGKERGKVFTALARELLGFIWAVGTQIEAEQQTRGKPRPSRRYQLKKHKHAA